MPANVVKTKRQERLWDEAKAQAKKQGKSKNYAYIMGIYKKMTKTGGALMKAASQTGVYKGKKVPLRKPMKTPGERKKSKVYVKNDKGNVVMVRFGDPNMSIKKDDPARRKSFRARHNCDNPGPEWKARYWSCKAW